MTDGLTNISSLDSATIELLRKALGADKRLTIISSYKLNETELKNIRGKLGISPDRVDNVVDPEIISGIIIRFGEYYLDYSFKGKLDQLTEKLNI